MKNLAFLKGQRHWVCLSGFLASALMAPLAKAHSGAQWTSVTARSECGVGEPSGCLGQYGFSVDKLGHFKVGPAPDGSELSGELEEEEFKLIKRAADAVAAQVFRSRCLAGPREAGSRRGVKMQLTDRRFTLVYHWEGKTGIICHAGSKEDSWQLEAALKGLSTKYYPLPFPATSF